MKLLKYYFLAILFFCLSLATSACASALHPCFAETEVVKVLETGIRKSKSIVEARLEIKNNSEVSLCTGAGSSIKNKDLRTISAQWHSSMLAPETLKELKAKLRPGTTVRLSIQSGSSMGENGAVPFEVFYIIDVK